jgi:hypothetical protein
MALYTLYHYYVVYCTLWELTVLPSSGDCIKTICRSVRIQSTESESRANYGNVVCRNESSNA